MTQTLAVVLAAGMGKRMKSDLPKVLCPVLGRPMIHFVLDSLEAAGIDRIVVVVGYKGELVREELAGRENVVFAEQTQQLGTGHAVKCALEEIKQHNGPVVVVAGDSPMIQADSLKSLLEKFESENSACLLGTLHNPNPTGLGRVVRDENNVFTGIVEEKDATDEQRKITEVNMSTYVFDSQSLAFALGELSDKNAQGEFYLTDCPGILKREGKQVEALAALKPCEALSINTQEDLQAVEAALEEMQV